MKLRFIFSWFAIMLLSIFSPAQQTKNTSSDTTNTSEAFTYVEEMPEFPGGQAELMNFLATNIRYPSAARENGIEGKVIAKFIVNTDGTISDIQMMHDIGAGCGEEVIRVLKLMPKWKPGKLAGRTVRVYYNLPVIFQLSSGDESGLEANSFPQYPSGDLALNIFIKRNLKYPKEAKKKKIEGNVVITFQVNEKGQAVDGKVIQSLGYGCDEEAIRVLMLVPYWQPGKAEGKPTAMPLQVTVPFNLK